MKLFNYLYLTLLCLIVFSCSNEKDIPQDVLLDYIEIKQLPNKLDYKVNSGETIDLDGLIVEGVYTNSERKILPVKAENIHGFTTEKVSDKLPVTVRIESKEAVFYVRIIKDDDDPSVTPGVTLVGLTIVQEPDRKLYMMGSSDKIDLTGLVVEARYSDETTKVIDISESDVFGFTTALENDNLPVTIRKEDKETIFYVKIASEVLGSVDYDGSDTYVVPEYVKTVAARAFAGSPYENVVLNEGLESIGDQAFMSSNVKTVSFPSTLKTIGKHAFYKCASLEEVDLSKTKVGKIDENVFQYSGIRSIVFPENLTEIADQAFLGTTNLTSVEVPSGVISIGFEAFRGSGIESVILPDNIHSIRQRAFYGCASLETVSAEGIEAVYSSGVVEGSVFEGCTSLKNITYPESISKIGATQLSSGANVSSLVIGKHVNVLGFSAFGNAVRIDEIVINAESLPDIDFYSLPPVNKIGVIKVPSSLKSEYEADSEWVKYSAIMQAIDIDL